MGLTGRGLSWPVEKGKGKEKARRPKEKNENSEQKKKPYHTPQQFSIPQMLDLEGHQSL